MTIVTSQSKKPEADKLITEQFLAAELDEVENLLKEGDKVFSSTLFTSKPNVFKYFEIRKISVVGNYYICILVVAMFSYVI